MKFRSAHDGDGEILKAQLDELMRSVTRKCPLTTRAMLARKFALPNYRQPDYFDQDVINKITLMMLMLPVLPDFVSDDVVQSQLLNIFQALHHDRPTLFLERELGEILVKTEIPGFVETSDIHFPFPSFRVMLPKKLLGIESQDRWVMYLDIGTLRKDTEVGCPKDIAQELDRYGNSGQRMLTRMTFTYPDDAIAISSQLDHGLASSYAVTKPLRGTLEQFKGIGGKLRTDFPNDAYDDILLNGMEKLAINILLILSSVPFEYTPEVIERKAHQEGKRIIPSLVRAKWVGDSLLRARKEGRIEGEAAVGYHVSAHWRSAHWVRQPYGPKRSLRRLIWLLPIHVGKAKE